MLVKSAWYRINSLVLQQLLLPGVQGVDRYKIWEVASECLPIIKCELKLWANQGWTLGTVGSLNGENA